MYAEFDYYGDRNRWFIARVIDNCDPLRQGRVQIHIDGIHSEDPSQIPLGSLPWAQTLLPTTEGGTSGIGKIPQLLPGALVFGIFLDGETSQLPLIFGHINQFETPSVNQRANTGGNINQLNNMSGNSAVVSNETRNAATPEDVAARRWAAMNFFARDNGRFYSTNHAAGIVGNLQAESSFKSTAVNPNDAGAGFNSEGIAQWNKGRLESLRVFARKSNLDWTDFNTQLLFVDHELRGKPLPGPGNDGAGSHASVYAKLQQTTTHYGGPNLSNSTWVICRYYEIPANAENKVIQRDVYAREAYNQYMQSISSTTAAV